MPFSRSGADGSLLGAFTMIEKPDATNYLHPYDQLRPDGSFILRTTNASYLLQPQQGGGPNNPIVDGERLVLRTDPRLTNAAR